MRVVLVDVRSQRGYVNKDTAVGGYGQRMTGINAVTRVGVSLRRLLNDPPSVSLAYLAALLHHAGREVAFTSGDPLGGAWRWFSRPLSTTARRRPGRIARETWALVSDSSE